MHALAPLSHRLALYSSPGTALLGPVRQSLQKTEPPWELLGKCCIPEPQKWFESTQGSSLKSWRASQDDGLEGWTCTCSWARDVSHSRALAA